MLETHTLGCGDGGEMMRTIWCRYYWRRRLFIVAWLVFPFLWFFPAIVITEGLDALGLSADWLGLAIIGLLPLVLFMWTGCSLICWPCPRCKKPIHVSGLFACNLFSRKCIHCALPIGDDATRVDVKSILGG
jgi:hypothetical protein